MAYDLRISDWSSDVCSSDLPFALHPLAIEDEVEMSLFQILLRLALDRRPGAAIPQHHRAAAIFILGDRALEGRVGKRMVLGPHREAFLARIEARPACHRPALEHAVDLEPDRKRVV